MSNVTTAALDQRAQNFATGIGSSVVGPTQRVVYFDPGVRYQPARFAFGMWHPYGLLGLGLANVKTSTTFGPSQQTYILGNDLSSTLNKLLLTVGVGVTAPFKDRYLVDISYRYGHISPRTSEIDGDTGISTNRIQAGIGLRF